MARSRVADLETITAAYRDECVVNTGRLSFPQDPYAEPNPLIGRPL
jgi:hypothetical protein